MQKNHKHTKTTEKEELMEEVIHAWSTPRSLSTSLMYSFSQRDDMEIVDEPFYANFLRVTGIERPYRDELLSKTEPDINKLLNDVIFGPGKEKYRYCKQIAYECPPDIITDLLKKGKHFILIRNPLNILMSFQKVSQISFQELGFPALLAIYSELSDFGSPPPVINAEDLQNEPQAVLQGLCEDLGIPFQASMLKWEAGPKEYDGVWAPWWYKGVHKSTCFSKPHKFSSVFPFELYDLLEQSMPFYNFLKSKVKRRTKDYPSKFLQAPTHQRALVWVGDELLPRESAKVSVFDSVVQDGDAVREVLCLHDGKILKLEEHLDRLLDFAKDLAFNNVPSKETIKDAIFETLISNRMFDKAQISVTLTSGRKALFGMCLPPDLYKCTLIVLAERNRSFNDNSCSITTNAPQNSPNTKDASIMLEKDGIFLEANASNIFMVKNGEVFTPHDRDCHSHSIIRKTVMDLLANEKLVVHEGKMKLSELQFADEVWTTAKFGEITPVVRIDGFVIDHGEVGPITKKIQNGYKNLIEECGVPIPMNQEAQ